jgi:hypothetical protein
LSRNVAIFRALARLVAPGHDVGDRLVAALYERGPARHALSRTANAIANSSPQQRDQLLRLLLERCIETCQLLMDGVDPRAGVAGHARVTSG